MLPPLHPEHIPGFQQVKNGIELLCPLSRERLSHTPDHINAYTVSHIGIQCFCLCPALARQVSFPLEKTPIKILTAVENLSPTLRNQSGHGTYSFLPFFNHANFMYLGLTAEKSKPTLYFLKQ